jgi:hypothetical protein
MRNLTIHLESFVQFSYIDLIYFFIDIIYELVFKQE